MTPPRASTSALFVLLTGLTYLGCGGQVGGDELQDSDALATCSGLTDRVHERVRTSDGAQLLTDSTDVANAFASKQGYDDGRGVVFLASKVSGPGLVPLYQVYNPQNGEHTWLATAAEKKSAMAHYGYTVDEGVAFYVASTSATCLSPVYRYLSPSSMAKARHRFVLSPDEGDALAKAGWKNEGIRFYVVPAAPTAPVSTRPTGPNTVRYEDLVRPGMTLQAVLDASGGKLLTFPPGVFEFSNFNSRSNGLTLPSNSLGIAGSGRSTIFRMKPHTSTKKAPTTGTNPLRLMEIDNCVHAPTFSNFQLQGTDQGHPYGGLRISHCDDVTVSNLYLVGASPGYANSPPGETFGIAFYVSNRAKLVNTEIDGRDTSGKRVCASPFGWNSSTDAYVEGGYFHHSLTGMPTFWETTRVTTQDIRSEYNGTGSGPLSGNGINHERSTAITHHHPTVIIDRQHGNTGTHFSFNNDQFNGSMTVIDPVWDDTGLFNGELIITSGKGYGGGHQKQTTPARVVDASGRAIAYHWVH